MKMLLVGDWSRTTLEEIGTKFASGEDITPPETIQLLARWHDPSSKLVWIVVDTEDAPTLQKWMVKWSNYVDWESYTVVDDEEVGAILEDVLHG